MATVRVGGARFTPETREAWATVGGFIRERRLELGISQIDVARLLDVQQKTVWAVEHGRRGMSLSHLALVMHALGFYLTVGPDGRFRPKRNR